MKTRTDDAEPPMGSCQSVRVIKLAPARRTGHYALMRRTMVVAIVGLVFGLLVWIITMASAPRYSYYEHGDSGNAAYFPVMLIAALLGGLIAPRRPWLVGLMLGLPAFVLAPWTAPRADNDGLWVLIVPILAVFLVLLALVATGGGWIRTRLSGHSNGPSTAT